MPHFLCEAVNRWLDAAFRVILPRIDRPCARKYLKISNIYEHFLSSSAHFIQTNVLSAIICFIGVFIG